MKPTYYIVKQSTDSRYGTLSIRKITSKKVIKNYLSTQNIKKEPEFTFPDLAEENTYGSNFHRNLERVYAIFEALPLKELKKESVKNQKHATGSMYYNSYDLNNTISSYLYEHGIEINNLEDLDKV